MGRVWVLVLLAGLWGCAEKVAPGAATYRPLPFLSTVTVTGGDVPGPLRVRDSAIQFADGDSPRRVSVDGRVEAVFRAWINGHGHFVGRWERDGETVDRVNVFITYGEALQIRLGGPGPFPTAQAGRHTIRFVMEQPEPPVESAILTYEVEAPYR